TSGTRELVLYNAQNTVTVNSIIENNGFGNSVVLVKSGAGTTLLTAANTYTGGTHVLQGTLNTTSLAALGSGAVTLNGGTLGLLWDGTAATNGAVTETLTVGTVINVEGSAGLTIGRVGTTFAPLNPLAVNKTVELTGLNIASPLPGNTTVTVNNNNGFGLLLSPALALPASGGALNFSVTNASASNIVQGLTLSGIVSGGQTGNGVITLMKSGAGAMVLSNAGNTFGGGGSMIDITGGYLSVGADAHLGDSGNIVRLSTGSLTQGLRATETFATSRQIMLNGASSGIEVTEGKTLTLNSAFTFSTATAGLGKNDLGTLVLTQGQTVASGAVANWDGVLTINQGAVRVTHNNALGTTTGNTVLAGVVGSAIELSGGVTVAEPLAINPGGNNTNRGILGQGALRSVSGINTWSGAITLITGGTDNQNRSATIKADAGSTLNLTGGLVGGTGTGGTGRDSWFGVGGEGTVNITTTTLTQSGAVAANLYSLVKIGSGTLNLQVANAMGGQQVIVKEGTLSVNGAGSLGVPTVGAPGTVFINPTATLEINNTVTPTTNRFSSRNLDLRGGNLTVLGNPTATTSETIGTVTLNYGAGVITLTADPAQALTVLQGNVTRNAGSSLLVRGTGLGSTAGPGVANLGGNTGATAYAYVGQLGASDTFNKSVLPYALGDTSDTGLGAGFLTSASIQGAANTSTNTLRVLNSATEQVTALGAPVLANTAENILLTSVVDFTASVFAGNPFLANTLQLNGGGGLQMVGMRTFTVDSGGILAFTGNSGITNSAALLSTTTNRELIVHALGNLTIASNIVGSTGGLTKTGAGTLELTSGFNTYTGATYINNGVLKLSGGDQTLFQNQNLTLMGGSLDLNGTIQNVNILRADIQALGRGDLHAPIGGSVINTSGTEATLAVTTGTTFSGTIGNGNLADSDIAVARSTAAGATSDWNLYGNNTYTGASLFNGGRVQLLDTGRLSGTTSIEISNATFLLGASNTSANLMEAVNRVNDLAPITLRGGMFQGRGYAAETYSETLGALTLAGAGNYIDIAEPGTNLNSMDYTFASLSQAVGSRATLRVFNVDGVLGTATRTFFTSAPTLTNNIIGGWAVFEREFASYIPQVGLGGLNSNGFAGYSTALINDAVATDNIRIVTPAGGSTTTLTGNRTMNSLNMQATGTATANSILDLGGNTLTLTSGGLILSPNTAAFAYTVQNGSITAGTTGIGGDLYLHGLTHFNGDADNTGNRDITVSSSIIDNAGGPVS
ncbi:MAG: autotransporter-associated beta strand repeat-containing protein, partial [Verrucomicrobiaceae bacterium]|nr:autotransporter-associated beta strand repeat-containing protein [Verrucomicrobiaceae bacterium]